MDPKVRRFLLDYPTAVRILGNDALDSFDLVRPETVLPEALQEKSIIGAIVVVNGRFQTALSEPLDERMTKAIAQAFVRYVEAMLPDSKTVEN